MVDRGPLGAVGEDPRILGQGDSSGRIDAQGLVDIARAVVRRIPGFRGTSGGSSQPATRSHRADPEPADRSATVGSETRYYTVQPGDSLSKIAWEAYGTAARYPVIFEANRELLQNQDDVRPGQVLRIPPIDGRDSEHEVPDKSPIGPPTTPLCVVKARGKER